MTAPIFVDDRAGSIDLMAHQPVKGIGELTRLDSADVMIAGHGPPEQPDVAVGVEVKTVWDLLSSANTGRLQATQIPRMLRDYHVTWLLFYGAYRPAIRDGRLQVAKGKEWRAFKIGKRDVPYGYLEALLLTTTELGVHVKHVHDIREAAAWLGVLHRWWSKPWSKHKGMRTFDTSRQRSLMPGLDEGTELRARVAAQLPGIGFDRAVKAARHFGSVREMVCADASEWGRVEGIGKVIAGAVTEALER